MKSQQIDVTELPGWVIKIRDRFCVVIGVSGYGKSVYLHTTTLEKTVEKAILEYNLNTRGTVFDAANNEIILVERLHDYENVDTGRFDW